MPTGGLQRPSWQDSNDSEMDPMLLELIRAAVASEGQALKTIAVLRASRSCFLQTEGASDAANAQFTQSRQSDPAFMFRYVGGMLLYAWVAERGPQSADESAERIEMLGTITTELKAIRAKKIPGSQFEVPAGFTRAP